MVPQCPRLHRSWSCHRSGPLCSSPWSPLASQCPDLLFLIIPNRSDSSFSSVGREMPGLSEGAGRACAGSRMDPSAAGAQTEEEETLTLVGFRSQQWRWNAVALGKSLRFLAFYFLIFKINREDPLEKELATHSSILAWRIPWTEEAGGLQSMESQRVGHDWMTRWHKNIDKIALAKLLWRLSDTLYIYI